jgi:hypothetical protein
MSDNKNLPQKKDSTIGWAEARSPSIASVNYTTLRETIMPLSIQLPDNLEQQLSVYCQENHLSINETIRLAVERLLTTNPLLSPYELGKGSFGADQSHEGDIAQHSKELLKARFSKNVDC